jgi:SPP1 gp7 family putative phage head morphogenesis protein
MANDNNFFKQALLTKRRGMRPVNRSQSRKASKIPWIYPWAQERQYAKKLNKWISPFVKAVEEYISGQAESILRGDSAIKTDALPGQGFTLLSKTLTGWIAQYYPDPETNRSPSGIMMGLGDTASGVKQAADREWGKQTKPVLGFQFNTSETWWKTLRDNWAEANFKLIKSNVDNYVTRVNDLVEKAVTNGISYQTLMADLKKIGGQTEGYVLRRIARDQIGKLNGQISKAQQTDAGIDEYTWQTAGDERVRGNPAGHFPKAIPSHYIMDGKLCRWDDATVYSEDKGKTWKKRTDKMPQAHPGMEIQCRCTAIPYMDNLIKEVDTSLGDKVSQDPNVSINKSKALGANGYMPQKTETSAQKWAEDNYENISWDLSEGDIGALNPTLQEFDILAKFYPKVIEQLKKIQTMDFGIANAYAASSDKRHAIYLNPKYYMRPSTMKEKLERDVQKGFHPKGCEGIETIFTHEFGHQVANTIMSFSDEVKKGFELFLKKELNKEKAQKISKYATFSLDEAFAEAFLEVHHNTGILSAPAKKVKALLKKYSDLGVI